jgi:hypothetical protein
VQERTKRQEVSFDFTSFRESDAIDTISWFLTLLSFVVFVFFYRGTLSRAWRVTPSCVIFFRCASGLFTVEAIVHASGMQFSGCSGLLL